MTYLQDVYTSVLSIPDVFIPKMCFYALLLVVMIVLASTTKISFNALLLVQTNRTEFIIVVLFCSVVYSNYFSDSEEKIGVEAKC